MEDPQKSKEHSLFENLKNSLSLYFGSGVSSERCDSSCNQISILSFCCLVLFLIVLYFLFFYKCPTSETLPTPMGQPITLSPTSASPTK